MSHSLQDDAIYRLDMRTPAESELNCRRRPSSNTEVRTSRRWQVIECQGVTIQVKHVESPATTEIQSLNAHHCPEILLDFVIPDLTNGKPVKFYTPKMTDNLPNSWSTFILMKSILRRIAAIRKILASILFEKWKEFVSKDAGANV
ncbi:hypothetical protein ACFE04_021540 [Oxalis oulophora]